MPRSALPVGSCEAEGQALSDAPKEGVCSAVRVPLALALEFHTETVGVKVTEAVAEAVDVRHCVGVELLDWLTEVAAERL